MHFYDNLIMNLTKFVRFVPSKFINVLHRVLIALYNDHYLWEKIDYSK